MISFQIIQTPILQELSPFLSAAGEPLIVVVYQHERSTLFAESVTKALTAEYYQGDGTMLKKKSWTPEMKAYAKDAMKRAPRKPSRVKITIFGKALLFLLVALIAYGVYDSLRLAAEKKERRPAETQQELSPGPR